MEAAQPGELQPIAPSPSLWAESRWAARNEGVVHLDDLLARRVRLNINLPGGGMEKMEKNPKNRPTGIGLGPRALGARGRTVPAIVEGFLLPNIKKLTLPGFPINPGTLFHEAPSHKVR